MRCFGSSPALFLGRVEFHKNDEIPPSIVYKLNNILPVFSLRNPLYLRSIWFIQHGQFQPCVFEQSPEQNTTTTRKSFLPDEEVTPTFIIITETTTIMGIIIMATRRE